MTEMTPALIVVFDEPIKEGQAELMLDELEDLLGQGEWGTNGHVEHATVSRCVSLMEWLQQNGSPRTAPPDRPTLGEAAAVMRALLAYSEATGVGNPSAVAMPALLDELAGAVRRLRAVTS